MEGIDMTKKLDEYIKGTNLLLEIEKLDVEVIQSLACTLIDLLAKKMDVPSEKMAIELSKIVKDVNEKWGPL